MANSPASLPTAVLLAPVVFEVNDCKPTAVLSLAVVLAANALFPTAVRLPPVVFAPKEA